MEIGFPMGMPADYEFTFVLRKFEEEERSGVKMPQWQLDIIVYLKRYIDDFYPQHAPRCCAMEGHHLGRAPRVAQTGSTPLGSPVTTA